MTRRLPLAAALCGALFLTACQTGGKTQPHTTAGLPEAQQMHPGAEPGTMVYRAPDLDVRKYKAFLIEAPAIYNGPDADFGGIDETEKRKLATLMVDEYAKALRGRYKLVSRPGPDVVRLRLTLAGVGVTKPALSAAARLSPVGIGATIAKSAAGLPASFTGSATIAGELIDTRSGQVIAAFIAKEQPQAADLISALGKLEAAEIAIRKGAADFRAAVDRAVARR